MTSEPTDAVKEDGPVLSVTSSAADADSLTLQDIDGQRWGEPADDASYLIRRGHELHSLPLRDLTVEDLRLLLGQRIGTAVLVPRALRVLADDPWAEGDFYPGDLLAAVLRLDDDYWSSHPDQRDALAEIAGRVDPASSETTGTDLPVLIAAFLRTQQPGRGH